MSSEEINKKLTNYFKICDCQRKTKTIIDNLYSIYEKCIGSYEGTHTRDFTGAELLIIAIMDSNSSAVTHGTNIEYPIILKDDDFWKWILEVRNDPNLIDN